MTAGGRGSMSGANGGSRPDPDVLVIGGGVIGCALAHRLTLGGARVTLVERGRIAGEASWATAGIISPPGSPLEARSFAAYPALIEELREATGLSVEYRRSGKLTVALAAADIAPLRHAMGVYRELGVVVEWLDGDEARRRESALNAAAWGALWFPAVGSLRGHRLTAALARAAQLGGATIIEGTPVLGLLTAGERVAGARIAGGELRAGQTVLAAGAWTAGIAAELGLPLPTRPVRGQMLALTGAEPPPRHILDGAGGYLIPRADGAVAVGATVDEGAGFDARVTPDGLTWLAGLVRALAPALTGARVAEVWAGLRPGSADGAPLLGRVPGYDGLWVAAGHGRNGILWAPVTADILAASILAGRPDPALAPYDPARFARAPVRAR